MSVRIEIKGLDELQRKLDKVAKNVSDEVKKAVSTSALMVEGKAKQKIQRGPKTGRIYQHGAVAHQASAPGQPPATDTGALASSITHEIKDNGATAEVGTRIIYGKFLEYGTRGMAARPFLFPSLEESRKDIKKLFEQAVNKGIKK